MASYRQVTIGIGKKHLLLEGVAKGKRVTETPIMAAMHKVFAWQAGHSIDQEMDSYGLNGAYPTRLQPLLFDLYLGVSVAWHHWLGLDLEEPVKVVGKGRTQGFQVEGLLTPPSSSQPSSSQPQKHPRPQLAVETPVKKRRIEEEGSEEGGVKRRGVKRRGVKRRGVKRRGVRRGGWRWVRLDPDEGLAGITLREPSELHDLVRHIRSTERR